MNKASLTFNASELSEIKSLSAPPQDVKIAITALLLLLGEPEEHLKDWRYVRRELGYTGDKSVYRRCQNFDGASLSPEIAERIKVITDGVTMESLKKVHLAMANVYQWVLQVVT